MFMFDNIGRVSVTEAKAGDIVMITGIDDITIGDTIMDKDDPIPLPAISVEVLPLFFSLEHSAWVCLHVLYFFVFSPLYSIFRINFGDIMCYAPSLHAAHAGANSPNVYRREQVSSRW